MYTPPGPGAGAGAGEEAGGGAGVVGAGLRCVDKGLWSPPHTQSPYTRQSLNR